MKRAISAVFFSLVFLLPTLVANADDGAAYLGTRRELFIDDFLVNTLDNVELTFHRPERKEVVMEFDRPWEMGGEGYATVLKVGDKYLLYYRAWGLGDGVPMCYCLAESADGRNWTRPELNLCDYKGVTSNNIMLDEVAGTDLGTQDFTPFLDERPGVPEDERYKAIGNGYGAFDDPKRNGVFAWKSPDGVHWTLMHEGPVYTDGKFDTQNVAFWSTLEKKYVLFYREFINNVRVVVRATSDDFIHWKREGEIQFKHGGGPTLREQFYTNQIQQYYRAPHIYIGLPTRYVDNGLVASTPQLPEWQDRQRRMKIYKGGDRLGTATTDTILITSRNGVNFKHYTAWNFLETPSADDDSPNELSIYAWESTNSLKPSRLRRYALRIDGFGSLHAKTQEGVAVTKPLKFEGKELSLNVATSSAGYVKVEVLDADGQVVPGFSADDCDLIFGDSLDRRVSWKGNADMSALAKEKIQLRFIMYEADVYSLKWE